MTATFPARPGQILSAFWTMALMTAVLWPSHALSMFDGMPLNGRAEAVVIGVVLPALWWAHRRFLERRGARALIVALLAVKVAGSVAVTQQGLCARFWTGAPFSANVLTIPIEEMRGYLRSWDVRADLGELVPGCTAIVDRPYPTASAFPTWFLNIIDAAGSGRRTMTLDLSGYVRVTDSGQFSIELDRDMAVTAQLGPERMAAAGDHAISAALRPGVHPLILRAQLTGERWRLVPLWNGHDAFRAASMTINEPRKGDHLMATVIATATVTLVAVLVVWWIGSFALAQRASPWALVWSVAAALVLIAAAASGRFERLAALPLVGAAFVPVAAPQRNVRGAFLLIGVPWLAFFVARSLPQVGHFSAYSIDDWLAYQVAGYRIFMNGFWLEAGSRVFDYQPLYRWMTGGLHMVFGDSSVGEVYWDSACLLMGALLCFSLVKTVGGFRLAVAAAATTLAIFTLGTVWYFLGRGLSEIAAAGWAFLAADFLLRSRLGRARAALAGGVFAVLMFYTRLNHLLFAGFLLALLLPLRAPAQWRRAVAAVRRVNARAASVYAATFGVGVALFALRTWWFTGVFSVLYGTSLKNNDTGLRLTTLASADVWRRVAHSLSALVWMNEPPAPDPRAAIVVVGVALSALALMQIPRVSRLPVSIAVVTLGASASSFFAHTHNYPGRMSIHLVPFAVAMTACAARIAFPNRSRRMRQSAGRAQVAA
jgi:hypothetical protein